MFTLVEGRRTWWPVKFTGVTEAGKIIENKIEMQFEILDEDEHIDMQLKFDELQKELVDAITPESADDAADTPEKAELAEPRRKYSDVVALFAIKFVRDWRGIKLDGSGDGQLEFNVGNLAMFFRLPNTVTATMKAYNECRTAAPETRKGN